MNVFENKDNIILDDLFEYFLAYKKRKLKVTSIKNIQERYNRWIMPSFGKCIVDQIELASVFTWKDNLIANDYSELYTNTIISEFNQLIRFGINRKLISNTILLEELDKIKMNKIVEERKVLTIEQINEFLDSFDLSDEKEYGYWLYFYAFANSGMRPNEFRCLQVKDISGNYLKVNKTVTSKLGKGEDFFQPPKSICSVRRVLMPHEIIELLLAYTKGYAEDDFIFGKDKIYRETNLNRVLKAHLEMCNLPSIVLYGFRHSHATHLINSGISIKIVSKRLGHKNTSTTMDTYWHLIRDDEDKILEVFVAPKKVK